MKNKKKSILNFNYRSYGAWLVLLFAILSAVIAILKVFGIEVSADQTNDVTLVITAILNVLVALGIVSAPMDKQNIENTEKSLGLKKDGE
ncbi:phage holin [Ligilactobacillus acidipiscis]|uniref:phage holin n=1 Tax=Ligilactobacillus acidipiscis TaxID=89059 RepID=UPI0023F9BD97|nr:phage holin [Ligilactobacillus acidipiscis]WEV56118.1 phage holin [Ligilactobacillus acidipiscis]